MKHVLHAGKIVAWCAVIALCELLLIGHFHFSLSTPQSGGGLALQPPAFLKAVYAADAPPADFNFLVTEAGITAYTKLSKPLDLKTLAPLLKTVGRQNATFISGIMVAPDYESLPVFGEKGEVQVFLHKDGWIVAYLTKWQRGAELFDWVHYEDKRLKDSTLIENVVRAVAKEAGAGDVAVSYYDFRYPDATNLLLVAAHAEMIKQGVEFQINIPTKLTVYESSWSQGTFNVAGAICDLDGQRLGRFDAGGWSLATGELSKDRFPAGKPHAVSISVSTEDQTARNNCGVAIVYKEIAK